MSSLLSVAFVVVFLFFMALMSRMNVVRVYRIYRAHNTFLNQVDWEIKHYKTIYSTWLGNAGNR